MFFNLFILVIIFIQFNNIFMKPVSDNYDDNTLRTSCGRDLAERLSKICMERGGYYSATNGGRFKRTIVNECCKNKCRDSDLYWYCATDDIYSTTMTYDFRNELKNINDNNGFSGIDLIMKHLPKEQFGTVEPEYKLVAVPRYSQYQMN